jgi:hypothetical protein
MVTKHGKSIPKNYKLEELRADTLGIHVRLDRGKVRDLTPAQKAEALTVFEQMAIETRQQLGEEPVGFKPGTVVCVSGAHVPDLDYGSVLALVVQDTGSVLRLQYLNEDFVMVRLTTNYAISVATEIAVINPDTQERFTSLPCLILAMAKDPERRLSWEAMKTNFPELVEDIPFLKQLIAYLEAASVSERGNFLKAIGDDKWVLKQITEGRTLHEGDLLNVSNPELLVQHMDNCDGWRNCDQVFRAAVLSVLLKHPELLTKVFPNSRGDLAYSLEDIGADLVFEDTKTAKASLLAAIKHGCHTDRLDATHFIVKHQLLNRKELLSLTHKLIQTAQSITQIPEYWEALLSIIYPMFMKDKERLLDVFRTSIEKLSEMGASNASFQDAANHVISRLPTAQDRETYLNVANRYIGPARRLYWDDDQGIVEIGRTQNEVPGP